MRANLLTAERNAAYEKPAGRVPLAEAQSGVVARIHYRLVLGVHKVEGASGRVPSLIFKLVHTRTYSKHILTEHRMCILLMDGSENEILATR